MSIERGKISRIVAGAPLRVEVQAVPAPDRRSTEISLLITGQGGEVYRWRPLVRGQDTAGFEIRDKKGDLVDSAEFEYG